MNSATLEGSLQGSAQSLVGLVNQGLYGVASCDVEPLLKLPAFRVTCRIASEDRAARIELATKQPARVLLEGVAQVEVRREGSNPEYNAGA